MLKLTADLGLLLAVKREGPSRDVSPDKPVSEGNHPSIIRDDVGQWCVMVWKTSDFNQHLTRARVNYTPDSIIRPCSKAASHWRTCHFAGAVSDCKTDGVPGRCRVVRPSAIAPMKLIAGIILFLAGLLAAQAEPTPTRSLPPKPRPLLLLGPFTGEKLVVRAMAATVQGNVLSVETEDGRKTGWDRTAIVATLPWYTDTELASHGVNLPALVSEYDNAAREHPEFRVGLAAEAAHVRTRMAALTQDRKEKLAAVFSFHYDPASPYTQEELRQRIQAAEAVAAIAPEEQLSIAKAVRSPARTSRQSGGRSDIF